VSKSNKRDQLSRRERQIMDAVYQAGRASAAEIHAAIPDAPTYTTVRTLLTILEQKGHVTHFEEGPRYVYEPTVPRQEMARASLTSVLKTFFDGSLESAVSTLMSSEDTKLSEDELAALAQAIERARKEGR
jgi:predicted transcriptional regulator